METIKTKINYYSFDISKENEKKEYSELTELLRQKGLKKFDGIGLNDSEYLRKVQYFFIEEIELETEWLFSNQWNTIPVQDNKGIRVFDWRELIFDNKKLKKGYWLEQTEEMTAIRLETFRCGYCGKQYHKPNQHFCEACLGSQYLKEKDLHLLCLRQILTGKPIVEINEIPKYILESYNKNQFSERMKRINQKKIDFLNELERKKQSNEREIEGFIWLVNHNLDFDNVIYYHHTNKFSFGWRTSLSKEEKTQLETALIDFPFDWQFDKK